MPEQLIAEVPLQPGANTSGDEGIHLLDVLVILARERWLVIGMTVLVGGVALMTSLMMTPIFLSTAKILPPQQQQGSGMAAMLGQLGGLAGAAGGIAGIKNPNDLYVGLLESRTVADNLIVRFKLKERYESATMDDARKALASVSVVSSGKKDGMISISATDKQPQFAADLANAYVDELAKLTQTMALTEASQRRLFFEKQLKEARDQLAKAEGALRSTQEKTGLIQPEAQVQAIITNLAQLKGTIAAKLVMLNGMRTYATKQNPELLRAEQELRALQEQLANLEKSKGANTGEFMVPTGKIPEVASEYVRRLRDVKYYETIFELLAKQFELAKIDEAKDSALIQLLDKAVPAERKAKPSRALITLGGLFAGMVAGIAFAFARAGYRSSRRNPATRARWEELALAWKRRPGKAGR